VKERKSTIEFNCCCFVCVCVCVGNYALVLIDKNRGPWPNGGQECDSHSHQIASSSFLFAHIHFPGPFGNDETTTKT